MTRAVVGIIGVMVGLGLATLGWWGMRRPHRLLRADLAGEYHGYRRFQLWELRIGGGVLLAMGAVLTIAAWFVPLPEGA